MNNNTTPTTRIDATAAVLWASAAVILAMLIVQAGARPLANRANAGNVSEIRDLVVLTATGGDNEDILAILDGRSEALMIYGIKNGASVELFQKHNLGEVFTDARSASGSRRP